MTPEQPCPHGMPGPSCCVDCMNDDGLGATLPPELPHPTGSPITARYNGDCRACPTPIVAGRSLIRRLSDESGWVHVGCTP